MVDQRRGLPVGFYNYEYHLVEHNLPQFQNVAPHGVRFVSTRETRDSELWVGSTLHTFQGWRVLSGIHLGDDFL